MADTKIFSISDFADFAQTTRGTLIFYDKIGLLKPALRGDNGYRYYSVDQIADINLIRTCQSSGIPLEDIKKLSKQRDPVLMSKHLAERIKQLDGIIDEQNRKKKLLTYLKQTIDIAVNTDASEIHIRAMPKKAIILGDVNDYSNGRTDYDALLSFYKASQEKYPSIDMNYPVWGYFSEENIKNGGSDWPDRYYFSNPDGNDLRPETLYAVGYGRGFYSRNKEIFRRIVKFINENGYEICGPAYCEYILNEISVADPSQYLACLMITVKK